MAMTKKQFALAGKLFKGAAEQYGNHGCNDLPRDTFKGWTAAEKEEFRTALQAYNGVDDPWPEKVEHAGDNGLMGYFAQQMIEMSK